MVAVAPSIDITVNIGPGRVCGGLHNMSHKLNRHVFTGYHFGSLKVTNPTPRARADGLKQCETLQVNYLDFANM